MKIKKESFHLIVIEITNLSNMDQDTGDKLNKKRFCVNPVICSKHQKKIAIHLRPVPQYLTESFPHLVKSRYYLIYYYSSYY